jgi:mono/diheme cytochrome c family protein
MTTMNDYFHSLLAVAFLLAVGALMAGCQSTSPGNDAGNETAGSFARYGRYLSGDIPEEYQGRSNPLSASSENIAAGRRLYEDRCTLCHGRGGEGDGPLAGQLQPAPADLSFTRMTPIGNDEFFFWTISEGGRPVGSAMPGFGVTMEEREVWQIVRYIEDGFVD